MAIGSGQLTKREGILVLMTALFLGAGAFFYMMPYNTRNSELETLRSRVESLEAMNQRARADVANGTAQQLNAEAEEYLQLVHVLRQLVPASHEVSNLLDQVAVAARREGLEVGGIVPQPVIAGPEFDTHTYKMNISGGFHSVSRFLTNVGALSRIVTPVNVVFSDKEASNAPSTTARNPSVANMAAEFEIRTYVARTEALPGASLAAGGNQ